MNVLANIRFSKTLLTVVLIATVLFQVTQAESRCGTLQAVQQHRKSAKIHPLAREAASSCTADNYYEKVLSRKTEHFQIFYTDKGPHKASDEFIDSVASSVEFAWNFHTKQLGMLPPLGTSTTHHYRQEVEEGLYPVEIIDIGMLRDSRYILGGICSGCYGLTLPSETEAEHSQLIIDNDFYGTLSSGAPKDTILADGKECVYNLSTIELHNDAHNYSYVKNWDKGIRVTAVHELYHAVQLRYLDMFTYWSFWFEASASGIEEIAAPEIDDYYSYLPTMFNLAGTPLDQMTEQYGAGIFLIYLHNFVNKKTDKFIWEGFARNPENNFQHQLKSFAESQNLSADSLFHDFATKVSFSGKRHIFTDSTSLISADQGYWPEYNYFKNSSSSSFDPALNNFAYKFYIGSKPSLENFKGKGSAILYKGDHSEIQPFTTTNEADNIWAKYSHSSSVDSIVWIFSKFTEEEYMPTEIQDSTLRAYPTPWRGGNLCFTPLPRNKDFIEIRNRRGNLISHEKYDGPIYCIEENRVKEMMVPGVYRFRVGNHGKTKDLLIIY